MITILRGTSRNLVHYTASAYTTPNDFIIVGSKDFALPFIVVRIVVPILRNRLGDNHVEDMLRTYKVPFSFIFNKLAETLTTEERQEQEGLAARLYSNITHSRVAKDAILKVYAQMLLDLKAKHDFRLIIPDMTHIDTGSLDLLLYLYQVFPDQAPDLIIGYDPVWEKPIPERDTGISWYYALDSDTVLRSFVYALEAVAADKKDIAITGDEVGPDSLNTGWAYLHERLDVLDERLELKAYALTRALPQQLDDEDKMLLMEGIQRCFCLYDFTNALLLSMRSLALLEPLISDREKARWYHIIALSAHNRHFFAQGNTALADFINDALQKALLYETDPAIKVAILYRLIVTQGRRKQALDLAYTYLDQAYQVLNEKMLNHRELLTAWINNIHSFLLMKQGKINEAIAVHEAGFYLLDKPGIANPPAIKNEIEFTMAVLAENLSTLNALAGNFKQVKIWYAIESKLAKKWSSLHAVPAAEWQSFYYQNLELGKALEKTEQGLAQSRSSFHYVLEYFFTLSAADIHYRLGNASDALKYFEKALVFQAQIGYEYTSPQALRICLVKTKIRLNRIEDALADIAEINKAKLEKTVAEQIEICLIAACSHGLSGVVETAEQQINNAIDLAVASGDCGLLVRVMLSAGLVCQQLNRTQDAEAAYHQALEMSQTVLDGVAYQPDTADLAEIYFGLYVCGNENADYLDQAIYNLSLSLKGNADSWWRLPQILAAFAGLPVRQRNRYLRKNKRVMSVIRKAAKQRNDCQGYISALKIIINKQTTTS